MGIQDFEFDTGIDADAIAALAFRLTWPGEHRAALAGPVGPRRRLVFARRPAGKRAAGKRSRLALLLPRSLRRKLAGRRLPLAGWPVALSVPSPDSLHPRMPSVKLTGAPLD